MGNQDNPRGDIFSANDALDINELASLNDDISPEFIEQLQSRLEQNASEFTGKPLQVEKDDSELFEEITPTEEPEKISAQEQNFEDNFLKKFNAKKNGQNLIPEEKVTETEPVAETVTPEETETTVVQQTNNEEIKELTSGNIIEKPLDKKQLEYNESLNYIDNNTKYSKYVIYIAPENRDFIESLTVKERKNLINRMLREQDDIAITKRRLGIVQTVIKHSLIAIITLAIAIPVVYYTINVSLEASINNYRRSQTAFKTLYREKGKIKNYNTR